MGKTYEALKRAEKEAEKNTGYSSVSKLPAKLQARRVNRRANEQYDDLKTKLLARNAGALIKTLLFVGTHHGAGCSTIAVNFAMSMAKDQSTKVLLVDLNLRTPALHDVFKVDHFGGVTELLSGEEDVGSKVKQVGPGNLCIITCGGRHSDPTLLFGTKQFTRMMEHINGRYDYIILDGPPLPVFTDCQSICAKVDGVVVVLESGKTRRLVALKAKKEIEDAGGKILGVVLNKRRHYIPSWLYRRL